MSLKEIIKFTMEQFVKKFYKQLCIGCLLVVSMLAFGAMFYMDYKIYGIRNDTDKVLATGISDKGLVFLHDDNEELKDEIRALDSVKYLGGYSTGVGILDWCEELREIKERNWYNTDNEEYVLEGIDAATTIMKDTMAFMNLKFASGGVVSEEEREEDVYYVYLGSDYKDIEVGSRYYMEAWDADMVIAGILEEGQMFLNEYLLDSVEDVGDALYPTDCMIFYETMADYEYPLMFQTKEGYTLEEAMEDIRAVCKKYGCEHHTISLDEVLTENENRFEDMFRIIKEMMAILALTIIVIQTCVCVSDFIANKRYYGILYANGMNNKDLIKVLVMQNLLLFVLCGIISVATGVLLFQNMVILDESILGYVIGKTGIVTLGILCATIVIPIIYITRNRTADLIYR